MCGCHSSPVTELVFLFQVASCSWNGFPRAWASWAGSWGPGGLEGVHLKSKRRDCRYSGGRAWMTASLRPSGKARDSFRTSQSSTCHLF